MKAGQVSEAAEHCPAAEAASAAGVTPTAKASACPCARVDSAVAFLKAHRDEKRHSWPTALWSH